MIELELGEAFEDVAWREEVTSTEVAGGEVGTVSVSVSVSVVVMVVVAAAGALR